jgi:hypothetical protein
MLEEIDMNTRVHFILLCLLLAFVATSAQDWVRRYLPPWSDNATLQRVSQDGHAGIVVAGTGIGDSTYHDFLTSRFDMQGEATWEQRYDNDGHGDDISGMAVAPDGRVVVCGQSWQGDGGGGGSYDWAVVSYRANGEHAWTTRFAPCDGYDFPKDIAMDAFGSVVVTGAANFLDTSVVYWPSFATLFIDTAGVIRWVARSEDSWVATCVALDSAGCAYVGGMGGAYSTYFLYVKYGPDGAERWRVALTDPYPFKAAVGRDGAVYFVGAKPSGSKSDYWLSKFDTAGHVLWQRTYDGPGHGEDVVRQIVLDESCNVYVTGWSPGSGTGNDICTVSWDSAGNQRWVARYGTPHSDLGYGLCLDRGFVYIVGELSPVSSERSDAVLLKYCAKDGALQWAQTYDGPAELEDHYGGVCVGRDGRVYVVGTSMRNAAQDRDALVGCYLADGTSVEDDAAVRVRPEPAGQLVRNTFVLHGDARAALVDATGRDVQELSPGLNDVRSHAPGVYFVREEPQAASPRPQAVRKVIIAP